MASGATFVKVLVIVINVVVCIVGLSIMGTAIWAKVDKEFNERLTELAEESDVRIDNFNWMGTALWTLIGFGLAIFLVGLIACCGALTENRCLLITYSVVLVILTVVCVGLGITILVTKTKIQNEAKHLIVEGLQNKTDTELRDYGNSNDCCGVDGDEQWCHVAANATESERAAKTPCADMLQGNLSKGITAMGLTCLIAALVMIIALIFTCCLLNAINRKAGYIQYQ